MHDNSWIPQELMSETESSQPALDTHTPPSQLPLATAVSEPGCRTTTSTASTWPSRLSTKGLANIRSIFTALRARVRSRARANGCMSGSRFRDVGVGSPGRVGRWDAGACCKTDIFWRTITIRIGQQKVDLRRTTIVLRAVVMGSGNLKTFYCLPNCFRSLRYRVRVNRISRLGN